jgi:very-short-patch-repair endonuclease
VLNDDCGNFVCRFDFAYPHIRLGIEARSWTWHSGDAAWHRDLERFNRIQDCGWDVLFVTKRDIDRGRDAVMGKIRARLGGQLPGLAG